MSVKRLLVTIAVVALPMFIAAPQAAAQTSPIVQSAEAAPVRHARRRIEIYPRPLLYRRCTDWYELQHRPSGTVLYPQMHCWWVRG
jgi:hypothetical protein